MSSCLPGVLISMIALDQFTEDTHGCNFRTIEAKYRWIAIR